MATKKTNTENPEVNPELQEQDVLAGAPADMLYGDGGSEEPGSEVPGDTSTNDTSSNEVGDTPTEPTPTEEGADTSVGPAKSDDYSVLNGGADSSLFNPGPAEGKGMQLTTTLGDGVPAGQKRRDTLDKFIQKDASTDANVKAEDFAEAALRGKGMSISTGIFGTKNADASKGPVGAVMPLGDATSYRELCHVNTPSE